MWCKLRFFDNSVAYGNFEYSKRIPCWATGKPVVYLDIDNNYISICKDSHQWNSMAEVDYEMTKDQANKVWSFAINYQYIQGSNWEQQLDQQISE